MNRQREAECRTAPARLARDAQLARIVRRGQLLHARLLDQRHLGRRADEQVQEREHQEAHEAVCAAARRDLGGKRVQQPQQPWEVRRVRTRERARLVGMHRRTLVENGPHKQRARDVSEREEHLAEQRPHGVPRVCGAQEEREQRRVPVRIACVGISQAREEAEEGVRERKAPRGDLRPDRLAVVEKLLDRLVERRVVLQHKARHNGQDTPRAVHMAHEGRLAEQVLLVVVQRRLDRLGEGAGSPQRPRPVIVHSVVHIRVGQGHVPVLVLAPAQERSAQGHAEADVQPAPAIAKHGGGRWGIGGSGARPLRARTPCRRTARCRSPACRSRSS